MRGIRHNNDPAKLSSLFSSYISSTLEYLKREEHHSGIYEQIVKVAKEHDKISQNGMCLHQGLAERIRGLREGDGAQWKKFIEQNADSIYYKEILSVQQMVKQRISKKPFL